MKKKLLIISFIMLITSYLFSVFYYPYYYLPYYTPFRSNKIDYYKIKPGISINKKQALFLEAFKQKTETSVDYDNQFILIKVKYDQYLLTEPFLISWEDYLDNSFESVYKDLFNKTKKDILKQKDRQSTQGIIPEIIIKLPAMALPKGVKKIMGTKAGRLNLSGSQKLTLSTTSTKKDTKQVSEAGNPTNFDITMKQDLNLNLNGTIGEKINVNVKYSSGQETSIFDPNNIKLSYTGDEDEIVQSIEAGNTSLSLSGSRFIGVSASSQGLFGIKTLLKIGDLNITAIASKEESQKSKKTFKGNSEAESTLVYINNYVRRSHYYIINPYDMYELYSASEAQAEGKPLWANNAIKRNSDGSLMGKPGVLSLLPRDGSLKVYLDNYNGSDDNLSIEGTILEDSTNSYMFDLLVEGEDYSYDYQTGILTFLKAIEKPYTIAVYYVENSGRTVGNDNSENLLLKAIKMRNQDINSPTWYYQQRNRYSLGSGNIKSDGFDLRIFFQKPDGRYDETVVYDSLEYVQSELNYYQYFRLDTDNNTIVNGDDTTIDLGEGYILFPFIEPFRIVKDSVLYLTEDDQSTSYKHLISIKGKVGRESIELGLMILPGSVLIKVNGREIKEGVDYIVDYDMGTVTILNKEYKSADADIEIDYENKPMFAIESKSLFGIRADWQITDQAKLGSTFIYQSEKVSDKRPKIGNESRSLILADIDGEVKFTPEFLTKAVDFLPLIKTDAESKITISGEVAMNVPKIYNSSSADHKDEAWLDDMEAVLDSYPLGTGRITWVQASKPYSVNLLKGKINWANPSNIYTKDVYDPATLSIKERTEKVSVLSMRLLPPSISMPGMNTPFYAGLMKYVGNELDFSDKEYIEILVKVVNEESLTNPVKMYIDLGDVSEDYYTDFGGLGVLNTEDGLNGGYKNGLLEVNEDVGLDGVKTPGAGESPNPDEDPFDNSDANEFPDNSNEYPYINGTEGNGRLDSEDLNDNSKLNIDERLFRYSVSLSDTESSYFQSEYNGWRIYRIPLKNNVNSEILSNLSSKPDLKKISFARVWFESDAYAKVNIVYIDIVGNKWTKMITRDRDLLSETLISPSELNSLNEYFSIETSDNQKDNHYVAPPKTTEKGKDDELSFEQALKTVYNNIQPNHIVLNRQGYRTPYNLLNYNNIKFWVYPEAGNSLDSLDVLFRLGSDSLNYYEISKRVNVNRTSEKMNENLWQEITIPFTSITYLKSINETRDTIYTADGMTFRKVRQPTLSNIKELAIGIQIPKNQNQFNGTVYFNEIRVSEPNQAIGFATRTSIDTKFADFSTLTINYDWKSSDFYSSYNRNSATSVGSEDKTTLSLDNKYYLQKFFPTQWGLNLPLTLNRTQSLGIPKYKSSSDVLRTNLMTENQDREKNKSLNRQALISYSLSKTPSNKFLAYTVKNITLSSNVKENISTTSSSADTLTQWGHSAAYRLELPKDKLALKLYKNYSFYFLPKSYTNEGSIRAEFPKRWEWYTQADSSYWKPKSQTVDVKVIETMNEIKYDIFSDITSGWKLTTKRDLMQRNEVKKINLGQETERDQTLSLGFDPTYTDSFLDFNSSVQSQYRQIRRIIKSSNVNEPEDQIIYDGSVNRVIRVSGTLKNSNMLAGLANLISNDPKKSYSANDRESDSSFEPNIGETLDESGNPIKSDNTSVDNPKEDPLKGFKSFEELEKEKALKDEENRINKEKNFNKDKTEKEKEIELDKDKNLEENPDEIMKKSDSDSLKVEDKKEEIKKNKSSQSPLSLLADGIGLLAKFQNFSLNYENQYGSQFDQQDQLPKFAYQLGLPYTYPVSNLRTRNVDDTYSASTGYPFFKIINADFKYSTSISKRYSSASTQTITTNWPDIKVTLSSFEKLINAEKILTSSRLSSSYSYTLKQSGDINWSKPRTEIFTTAFSPIIGFTGNWIYDITSSVSVSKTNNKSYSYASDYSTLRQSDKMAYNATMGYTFTAENGFKIPFFKKRITFKNQLQSDLSFVYEDEQAFNEGRSGKQKDRDQQKFSVTPRASYNFHTNLKGGLSGSYETITNNMRGEKTNIFKLDIWVEIQF